MINTDTNYWSEHIVVYCGKNRLSLRDFAKLSNLHHNTILHIVSCKTKSVTAETAGILYNTIFRNTY